MSSDSISTERIKGTRGNILRSFSGSNGNNGDDDVRAEPSFAHSKTVPAKYLGSIADRREMTVLGKEQVLRVRFGRPNSTFETEYKQTLFL